MIYKIINLLKLLFHKFVNIFVCSYIIKYLRKHFFDNLNSTSSKLYVSDNGTIYANSPEEKLRECDSFKKINTDESGLRLGMDNIYHESKIKCFYPYIDKLFNNGSTPVIVDVCGGRGISVHVISKKYPNINILGIELSRDACVLAKKISGKAFITGDAEDIPLSCKSTDAVLLVSALHHFYEYPIRTIQECHRILKPDGFLFLNDPYLSSETSITQHEVKLIRNHIIEICKLLSSLHKIQPSRDTSELSSNKEAVICSGDIHKLLVHNGFKILEQRFINHTIRAVTSYMYGQDLASLVDSYLEKVSPLDASMVSIVAQKIKV